LFITHRLKQRSWHGITASTSAICGSRRRSRVIKRRTIVVGIFPNDEAIVRVVGAILLEQNDEWAVQRARYTTLEIIAALSDKPIAGLPAMATWPTRRPEASRPTPPATPPSGTRSDRQAVI
jgi:Transposase, Mutator family